LGDTFDGSRLSKRYAENLDYGAIISIRSSQLTISSAGTANTSDDYTIRAGFIAATVNGTDFHKGAGARR